MKKLVAATFAGVLLAGFAFSAVSAQTREPASVEETEDAFLSALVPGLLAVVAAVAGIAVSTGENNGDPASA